MIADFSQTVSGSAEVVNIAHVGQNYVIAIAHTGSGSVGTYTWNSQPAGGLLLAIAHNGTVIHDTFTTLAPRTMEASASTVVVVANHSSNGIVTQAFDAQLALQGEQHFIF
jgi:hypothetical protein